MGQIVDNSSPAFAVPSGQCHRNAIHSSSWTSQIGVIFGKSSLEWSSKGRLWGVSREPASHLHSRALPLVLPKESASGTPVVIGAEHSQLSCLVLEEPQGGPDLWLHWEWFGYSRTSHSVFLLISRGHSSCCMSTFWITLACPSCRGLTAACPIIVLLATAWRVIIPAPAIAFLGAKKFSSAFLCDFPLLT